MLLELLSAVAIVIGSFVSALFIVSIIIKRNDIADIAWGTGILIVSIVSYVLGGETHISLLLLCLSALWGVRLSLRILVRNIKKDEDYRYKAWRDSWGKWFYLRSYLQVYLLQGCLMIVVGYPFVHTAVFGSESSLGILSHIGIFIWCIGYFFEVIGDYQLDRFIKNKPTQGEILQTGLWKYTRHPNYFGEVTMWWGIGLITITMPYGVVSLISAVTITYLILKVSGIPMLEKKFEGNPAFEDYKQRTSVFFPLPPKKSDA